MREVMSNERSNDFPHWQNRLHLFTRQSATEDASPSWMSFITRFSYGEIAFQGIVNLKTCRETEIETERLDDARDQEKRTEERAKKFSSRENWYVISVDIRFCAAFCTSYPKQCTCFPIGDVRDRRRVRYNRVYALSRVRNNRVSLHWKFLGARVI